MEGKSKENFFEKLGHSKIPMSIGEFGKLQDFPCSSVVKTVLPLQGPWVQPPVGELRSHMPCDQKKQKVPKPPIIGSTIVTNLIDF